VTSDLDSKLRRRSIWVVAVAVSAVAFGMFCVGVSSRTHHPEVAPPPNTVKKAIAEPQYFFGPMKLRAVPHIGPTAEPSHFVAELRDEVAVVDSHTGRALRNLIPIDRALWTLSRDGNTFYFQVVGTTLPSCPSKICAIDIATGATTPVQPFRWGATIPSENGTPISPDGTHAASTNFGPSPADPTVTIATTTGDPVTYHLPEGEQIFADPIWSPNGVYLEVADIPGVTGQRFSAHVILDVETGTTTTLTPPRGCDAQPLAFSDTELFTEEVCGSVQRILPYRLPTLTAETPRPNPPGTVFSVASDGTGQDLVAATLDTGPGADGPVWTEQSGVWTRVPNIRATVTAW
jgi:hypothetical protein